MSFDFTHATDLPTPPKDGPPVPFAQLKARADELAKLAAASFAAGDHETLEAQMRELELVVGWAQNPDDSGSYGGFDEVTWRAANRLVGELSTYLEARASLALVLRGEAPPERVAGRPAAAVASTIPLYSGTYQVDAFYVNGAPHAVDRSHIDYGEIVSMVRDGAPNDALYTVTYKGGANGAEGILDRTTPAVPLAPGMSFNAVVTGSA